MEHDLLCFRAGCPHVQLSTAEEEHVRGGRDVNLSYLCMPCAKLVVDLHDQFRPLVPDPVRNPLDIALDRLQDGGPVWVVYGFNPPLIFQQPDGGESKCGDS